MRVVFLAVFSLMQISVIQLAEKASANLFSLKTQTGDFFRTSGKLIEFVQLYQRKISSGPFRLRNFDAQKELREYVTKISQLIVETKASLQTAVSWAEEEVSKYAWNPNLTLSDTHSIKLRNLDSSDERLTTSPSYPFRVLLGRSGVHIPEEIYDGDPHVFHTLLWTEALDFIFNTTKGLRFIYFASVSGIFRVYPAFPWDLKVVDVFDIRYTPWYIQGSAVPKDLLIMLDTSGSMTGQSLKLANVSAQKLVMDLDENDYFAVTHFPEPDNDLPLSLVTMNQTAPPCFRSFVRATRRNKLQVFRELGNLTARGYAKFDRAFAMAIDMFNELNNSTRADRTSALCNQVLVVITDSALDFDGKTLDALKNKPEHIHVLIYALGEPVSNLQHYQSQICPYRGQYTYIPTAGAVSNMMEHYHEKSTRTLLGPEGSPIQPEVLLHGVADIFQTKQYQGTGLMVSLSMPVYNRTDVPHFMGLMGTDLPIERAADQLSSKLKPLGYVFALNRNGYVVFHPGLKPQVADVEDPPKLDWLDLEFDVGGRKTEIRRKMIDNEDGTDSILDFIKVADSIHTYSTTRNIVFTGTPNTKFGMAIVIPPDHHLYLGADDGAQLAVSKDASGVFSVDNVPIVKLLTTARVFLPVACIDLEFESITSQFDSFASITLPAAATEATPSAPPEGGMNTVGTSVMETVNYNEAGHLSAANMTESEPVLDFLSKIFHKRDVSSYTERSVLLNENSCKAMNHSAECMVQLQPTDSQSETTAGVTPVSIAVDVTTATTSRITVSAEASQLLTDKGVSTTDISNLELFLDQVQRLSQNPSEVITRILFDLIVAEVDVTQYYVSGSLESPVRSRTILLNSGLAWTIPIDAQESFEDQLLQWPLSPIVQRVFDSNELVFWIPIKMGEPEPVSAMVNSSYLLNETDVERELYSESTSLSDRTDLFLDLETDDLNVTDTSTHNVSLQTSQPIPVTVFKAIEIPETPTPFKVGVMGLTLEPEFFPHLLRQVPECSEDSSKVCYLLEDAAYIVAVNDESLSSHIGRFLGYMDPPLMHALLENHVYDVVKDYSMQAICTPVEGTIDMESTGYRSRSSFLVYGGSALALVLWNRWWREDANQGLYWSHALVYGIFLPTGGTHTENNHEPYSCIQLTHRYFVPRPGTPIPDQSTASTRSHFSIPVRLGTLSCSEDCQRDWTVRDIDGTNLKLLIADPRCSHCGDLDEKLPRDPVEDSGPDVCREAVNPRYRRLLDKCLSSSLQTDPPKCAAFRSVGQFVHVLTMTVLLFAHRCLFL